MNNFLINIISYSAIKLILVLILILLVFTRNVFSQMTQNQTNSKIYSPLILPYYSNISYPPNKEKNSSLPHLDTSVSDSIIKHILHNMSVSASTGLPLKYTQDYTSSQQTLPLVYNISSAINVRYSYNNFFTEISIIKYAYKQPWNPDFTYSFGYNDWHPKTINFQYENYTSNRLHPSKGERFTRLEKGSFSAHYKFLYPNFAPKLMDAKNRINGSIGLSVVPKYYNFIEDKKKYFRYIASIGASYQLMPHLNLGMSFLYYFKKEPQESWDPDFTYNLSYSRPINYGNITISYQNYNGTRYPWKKKHRNFLALRDGSIGIAFSTNLHDLFYKEKRKN